MFLHRFCHIIASRLAPINKTVGTAGVKIAAVFLAVMVVVVLAQILFRYILNDSLAWAEELAKAMMVWMAFLVAPLAMRSGANVSIEMLAEALPVRLRIFLQLIIGAAVIWVLSLFLIESVGLWQRGLTVSAASLPVKMAFFYSIVPVGFIALQLVAIELFFRDIMAFIDPASVKPLDRNSFSAGDPL